MGVEEGDAVAMDALEGKIQDLLLIDNLTLQPLADHLNLSSSQKP